MADLAVLTANQRRQLFRMSLQQGFEFKHDLRASSWGCCPPGRESRFGGSDRLCGFRRGSEAYLPVNLPRGRIGYIQVATAGMTNRTID